MTMVWSLNVRVDYNERCPAFQGYSTRKVGIAWARSAEEYYRLPKIVLFGQPSRAKRKAGCRGWGGRMSQRKI